jgi:phosphoribosylpyrophosphate synthetase
VYAEQALSPTHSWNLFQRPSPKKQTPSIQRDKVHVVSIAPLLGEAINRIHQGQSVISLFAV